MERWMQDGEILASFQAEAEERLQNLNQGLLTLEKDPGNQEVLDAIFRDAHTLKGSAGMMGLTEIKELAHRIEDVLGDARETRLTLSTSVFNCLFKALDTVTDVLQAVLSGGEHRADTAAVCRTLEDLRVEADGTEETSTDPPSPEVANTPRLTEPTEDHEAARQQTERQTDNPPAEAKTEKRATAPKTGQHPKHDDVIKVSLAKLDVLLNLVGELVLNKKRIDEDFKRMSELTVTFDQIQHNISRLKGNVQPWLDSVSVEKARPLQQITEVVGTLVGKLHDQSSGLKDAIYRDTQAMDIVTTELEAAAMRTRMLPVSTIFTPFHRAVRDLSQEQGKDVRLLIEGGDTELDKKVLEQIADPLMHLIRNCVDHGIELPEERETSGKPRLGTIKLAAYQKGDQIVVEVSDDGRGIDVDKIRTIAASKGLLDEEGTTGDDQTLYTIFRSGFSTAERVSDVSGRGVGLDVVRNNIEALDGNIGVETEKGQGTAFLVSLPVTLALLRGLIVGVGNEKYALPLAAVQESRVVEAEDINTIGDRTLIRHRERSIPVAKLSSMVGAASDNGDEGRHVVILSTLYRTVGFFIDELIGEHELVVKSLGAFLADVPNLAGATILGNGDIVLILDPNSLIRKARLRAAPKRAAADIRVSKEEEKTSRQDPSAPSQQHILIVEDSLTVRELERNILEAAGYTVETAADGLDALAKLGEVEVDLAIVDVDMPRMNGFELTRNLRESDRYRELPIVMVTARATEADKRKGIEAGANAYIIKKSFEQETLLEVIEQLTSASRAVRRNHD